VSTPRRPVALTVAGTDSGGGAGIAADLKTFEVLGVWGTCCVVAVTAQNTLGVQGFDTIDPALVDAQIDSVATDIGVDAVKTGMLATAAHVEVVAAAIARHRLPNLVVDPVLVSRHGDPLLAVGAVGALRSSLLPLARVVTPNLPEAAALCGVPEADLRDRGAMEQAAAALADLGVEVVVVKGGHLGGSTSPDLVWSDGKTTWLEGDRIPGRHTHGTGCTMSAAIAAGLANGCPPIEAVGAARALVRAAIAGGVELGSGVGPVDPAAGRI